MRTLLKPAKPAVVPTAASGSRRSVAWRLCALSLTLAVSACATDKYTNYDTDVVKRTEQMRKGPKQAPVQTVTSFNSALRCMDIMFMTYGVRDIGVLIEDIPDSTRKVKAGVKDMVISAVSQMSRRSRGIRLVAFSINDQTLGAVVGFGTRDRVIENTPDFTIRGSISQFDDGVVKKQGDAGVSIGPAVSAGVARQGSGSVLALDLSMINTNELTLVPGVISKNSVLLLKQGAGSDGEVSTRKFGLNFSFTLAKSEGKAQALRTLAELATIELLGKLTKIPYWVCLGASDEEELVKREITDWWETLAAEPISLVAYFQQQMFARGLYAGEVTGQVDDQLLKAIEIYQQAMGREPTPTLDFEFFQAYLKTDHVEAQKVAKELLPGGKPEPVAQTQAAPAVVAAAAQASAAPNPNAPPFIFIAGSQGKGQVYSRGQPFQIDVAVDQDAFLYCYLYDENRRVNQFFPNPAVPDPQVKAGTRLKFPGDLPFRLVASPRGATESITCYASQQTLGQEPLKSLPVASGTDQITASFRRIAGPKLGVGVYDVQVQ